MRQVLPIEFDYRVDGAANFPKLLPALLDEVAKVQIDEPNEVRLKPFGGIAGQTRQRLNTPLRADLNARPEDSGRCRDRGDLHTAQVCATADRDAVAARRVELQLPVFR